MLEDGFYFVGSNGTYTKFDARLTKFVKNPQIPIKADELEFVADLPIPMPDYVEFVYVKKNVQVFHGRVTDRGEGRTVWNCKSKAMWFELDWRYIPDITYHGLDINTILGSGLPTSSAVGALFALQSIIPNGKWVRFSSTGICLLNGGKASALRELALYACTNYPYGTVDGCDGIHQLTEVGSSGAVSTNNYYRNDVDLYLRLGDGSYLNNAYYVFAAFWLDSKIRLGTVEVGTSEPSIDISLEGVASKSLNDFFEQLAMEPEFVTKNDGYIYLNLASEAGRGSASAPLMSFVDGANCNILIDDKQEPDVQAVVGEIGDSGVFAAAIDFSRREPQLIKNYDGKGELKEELEEALQDILDQNTDCWTVTSSDPKEVEKGYFLRIGDYVSLTKEKYGSWTTRIQRIEIKNSQLILSCGKRPPNTSSKFGELLRTWVDPDIKTAQIKDCATSGSTTFVAKATDVATGFWKCYAVADFTQADDDTPISTSAFLAIAVNSKIVPPGRIKIEGGSIEIDITEFCNTSASADTNNTIQPYVYNGTGWTLSKLQVKKAIGRGYS